MIRVPQIVNTKLVQEIKKLFQSLKYKWSFLKGEITTVINCETEWIQMKWNQTMKVSLDFFKPVKLSELLSPIIGYILTKYPEENKAILTTLKEIDKYPIPQGIVDSLKGQLNNHKLEINYENGQLSIIQSIPNTDNIAKFVINDELMSELFKLIDNKEGVEDLVFSILPPKSQTVIKERMKEDFEQIYEYRVHEILDKKYEDNEKVTVDYDLDCKDDCLIVRINNEKKYKFIVKSKDKCVIEVNSKEFAICHTMSEVIEVINSL